MPCCEIVTVGESILELYHRRDMVRCQWFAVELALPSPLGRSVSHISSGLRGPKSENQPSPVGRGCRAMALSPAIAGGG